MSDLLISLCFPLWVYVATDRGLLACRDHGVSKLAHLTERGAPLRVLDVVEDALGRIGAELDARAWKRAQMARLA